MTTSGKGHIFISYRRSDSAPWAGRIYDRLTAHFGKDVIFMDVDTIEAGVDFVDVLQNAVQSCDVLVALIGRRWLDIKDGTGKRRLDNPEDFVRIEVATALERDIRVIPVLVDGVSMPYSTELPNNLKSLVRRNALQVDHHSFNSDARRLISQLELALKAAEDSRILKARKLEAEKARREKESAEKARLEDEERNRKKEEEKERIEKETREKAEADERAKLAAVQKAKKERQERERRESEEKARKAAQRKVRLEEATERIRNIFSSGNRLPIFVSSGVVILFLLGYIIIRYVVQSGIVPESPAIIATLNLPPATLTDIPTNNSPSPTPTLGVGSTMISDKDGMVMAYVPAGEFQMGSADGEDDEKPVHAVYLDAFWIDQTEVTNAMYAICVGAGKCDQLGETGSNKRDSYYGNPEFDDYPVIYISWNAAKTYCEWAGRHLPSEAQWEKAAIWDEKSQSQRVYPWGDTINESYGNYGQDIADTSPVGNYEKGVSYYGTYDMSGNVMEWVADWYDSDYYASSPSSNPKGPDSGSSRVLRDGGWLLGTSPSTSRGSGKLSLSNSIIGFRCALSAETP